MSEVSTCCGSSYEENVRICGHCSSFDIGEEFAGDEGWTVCRECNTIEGEDNYVNVCEECEEICKVEEESEYEERMRENALEEKSDARRKYGE